jgi:hypothetical protein
VVAGLPILGQLLANEAEREDVEQNLGEVEASIFVLRIDGDGVEDGEDNRDDKLGGILEHGHTDAVGVQMHPVVRVVAVLVVDKGRGVVLVLNEPTPPQVHDALLVARRGDDLDGV